MDRLLAEIRQCRYCEKYLPLGARPILTGSVHSKLIIISQAPGRIVHETGIPWNDKSGDNLRNWLGIEKEIFYDSELVSLMPMGFCFPGKGVSGDLPPRPECAPLWHEKLFQHFNNVALILLIGSYAQNYYLKEKARPTLTETVLNYKSYLPQYFPLPHPSPRNNIWQAKNKWFAEQVLPDLKMQVHNLIHS